MDSASRCNPLETRPNPGARLDYVIHLQGHVEHQGSPVSVSLRYIPDKLILSPQGFEKYLSDLSFAEDAPLEQVAVMVLEDLNNETIARWIQVYVRAPETAFPELGGHGVLAEDRQPKWDNPDLLARLKEFPA